jgi:hypothetical protein
MIRRFAAIASALALLGLSSGCAVNRAQATLMPDADLSQVKSIYVVHEKTDNHAVDETLKTALEKRGYAVTLGPEMPTPYPADATVTYVDKWMWDITMYMIELRVTVRDGKNDFPLATADSMHTSLTRKSQPEMVDEAVTNILAAKH